jgi:hypothetical protein
MKLYTVEITFSDFTFGIEQVEADSVEEAVELFFQKAECFENYDRKKILNVVKNRLNNKNALIHVANDMRGVWLINVGAELQDLSDSDQPSIYGGKVIQSDPSAPRRA